MPRGLGAVLGAGAELLTEHSVETFGLGDVELALPLGLALGWHGWTTLVLGLLGGFVAFALAVLVLLAIRRTTRDAQLPFGPWMMLGAGLALAVATAV